MTSSFFRSKEVAYRIAIIDGPNMSSLGTRNPKVYGVLPSWEALRGFTQGVATELGIRVTNFVSNHEGEILDWIHATKAEVDGWLINPAGLATTGEATRYALMESGSPYVEVHFANTAKIYAALSGAQPLESKFTLTAQGLSMGFRQYSYASALVGLVMALDDEDFVLAGTG